jgi:hypothetical protein
MSFELHRQLNELTLEDLVSYLRLNASKSDIVNLIVKTYHINKSGGVIGEYEYDVDGVDGDNPSYNYDRARNVTTVTMYNYDSGSVFESWEEPGQVRNWGEMRRRHPELRNYMLDEDPHSYYYDRARNVTVITYANAEQGHSYSREEPGRISNWREMRDRRRREENEENFEDEENVGDYEDDGVDGDNPDYDYDRVRNVTTVTMYNYDSGTVYESWEEPGQVRNWQEMRRRHPELRNYILYEDPHSYYYDRARNVTVVSVENVEQGQYSSREEPGRISNWREMRDRRRIREENEGDEENERDEENEGDEETNEDDGADGVDGDNPSYDYDRARNVTTVTMYNYGSGTVRESWDEPGRVRNWEEMIRRHPELNTYVLEDDPHSYHYDEDRNVTVITRENTEQGHSYFREEPGRITNWREMRDRRRREEEKEDEEDDEDDEDDQKFLDLLKNFYKKTDFTDEQKKDLKKTFLKDMILVEFKDLEVEESIHRIGNFTDRYAGYDILYFELEKNMDGSYPLLLPDLTNLLHEFRNDIESDRFKLNITFKSGLNNEKRSIDQGGPSTKYWSLIQAELENTDDFPDLETFRLLLQFSLENGRAIKINNKILPKLTSKIVFDKHDSPPDNINDFSMYVLGMECYDTETNPDPGEMEEVFKRLSLIMAGSDNNTDIDQITHCEYIQSPKMTELIESINYLTPLQFVINHIQLYDIRNDPDLIEKVLEIFKKNSKFIISDERGRNIKNKFLDDKVKKILENGLGNWNRALKNLFEKDPENIFKLLMQINAGEVLNDKMRFDFFIKLKPSNDQTEVNVHTCFNSCDVMIQVLFKKRNTTKINNIDTLKEYIENTELKLPVELEETIELGLLTDVNADIVG